MPEKRGATSWCGIVGYLVLLAAIITTIVVMDIRSIRSSYERGYLAGVEEGRKRAESICRVDATEMPAVRARLKDDVGTICQDEFQSAVNDLNSPER
jgi:hypothetical protein